MASLQNWSSRSKGVKEGFFCFFWTQPKAASDHGPKLNSLNHYVFTLRVCNNLISECFKEQCPSNIT